MEDGNKSKNDRIYRYANYVQRFGWYSLVGGIAGFALGFKRNNNVPYIFLGSGFLGGLCYVSIKADLQKETDRAIFKRRLRSLSKRIPKEDETSLSKLQALQDNTA